MFSPAHMVFMHKRTERRYCSTNWCWNLFHAHQCEWTWCHDLVVRVDKVDGPMQTICQSLVQIRCIYKNLICKSLQHCSVIQCWTRQSCGDIQSCGDMSPKKLKFCRPLRPPDRHQLCPVVTYTEHEGLWFVPANMWKINILKPKHLEVWLEDDVPFHLDDFLGSSRILQGCMPSLDMLQLGYHQWSSVWKLTIPMGSRNGNCFVLFFPRFFGSHKIYGNVYVHLVYGTCNPYIYGCLLYSPFLSPRPHPKKRQIFPHIFQFNRSSVWCWRRLWRFLLVIIPVRKAQKHWEGEVSEGDDSQVFVGEWVGEKNVGEYIIHGSYGYNKHIWIQLWNGEAQGLRVSTSHPMFFEVLCKTSLQAAMPALDLILPYCWRLKWIYYGYNAGSSSLVYSKYM